MLKIHFKNLIDAFQSALVVTLLALIPFIGGVASADAQEAPPVVTGLVFATDGQAVEGNGIMLTVTLSEASSEAFVLSLDLGPVTGAGTGPTCAVRPGNGYSASLNSRPAKVQKPATTGSVLNGGFGGGKLGRGGRSKKGAFVERQSAVVRSNPPASVC